MVQQLWKTVWWALRKLNTEFAYHLAIPFLSIYPREMKIGVETKSYAQMFIVAQLVIAKRWQQP